MTACHYKIISILILLMNFTVPAAASTFQCTGNKGGANHRLTIIEKNDTIESISYLSITNDNAGYQCDVTASRTDDSTWSSEHDEIKITIPIALREPKLIDVVSIAKIKNGYKVTIDNPKNSECGLNGFIARSVILLKTKAFCGFPLK
jgi:hypothetical protein